MKKGILGIVIGFACSSWANGKATVLKYDDASQTPHVQSCRLYYENSAMTVDQVLLYLKADPSLAGILKEHLGIKKGNVEDILAKKTASYKKDNHINASDCKSVKMNDLFQDIAAMKNCSKLEKLTTALNKSPAIEHQVQTANHCGPEKAGQRLPASTPGH